MGVLFPFVYGLHIVVPGGCVLDAARVTGGWVCGIAAGFLSTSSIESFDLSSSSSCVSFCVHYAKKVGCCDIS
jgi:hypothetical protein